jgi:CheY-like chemotaxis protein
MKTGEKIPPRRILLIEDNEDAAESLQMLLELAGHEVLVARCGVTGVEAAQSWKPEVVLSDLGLPGAMDGYAVARALRSAGGTATSYLVALSGYGQESDKQRAREAGFDAHLTKPVEFTVLSKLLAGGAAS